MELQNTNYWFLYETLSENEKSKIKKEIENKIHCFLSNNSSGFTKQEFDYVIYDEVIRGYYLNLYLGQSVDTFALKEQIVRSNAERYMRKYRGE